MRVSNSCRRICLVKMIVILRGKRIVIGSAHINLSDDEDDYRCEAKEICEGSYEDPNKAENIRGITICQAACQSSEWLYADLS